MISFVGIGPGDPELLTLKAQRLIRSAGAIAFADTGTGGSAVREILGNLLRDQALFPLSLPMRGGRDDWRAAHEAAAQRLIVLEEAYRDVVYPVLGDPSLYASSGYLYQLIEGSAACEIVPGVPAMCACAARLGVTLCDQGERLTVLDGVPDAADLPEGNVVVMKCAKHLAQLKAAPGRKGYAVRNLGRKDEWIGPLRDLSEEDASYFTTALLFPRDRA